VNQDEQYAAWISELGRSHRFGTKDRKGTTNYIDEAAHRRAIDAMRTGFSVSLARPLEIRQGYELAEGHLTVEVSNYEHAVDGQAPINAGFDVMHVAAHGQRQTHLDGFNHCGFGGEWYSGFPVDDPDGPSIAAMAGQGLFTRGVVADIPAVRGTDWADAAAPVTGDDIDAALSSAGAAFEPGDALLLYMGRDRFEAAGHSMDLMSGAPTPGAGAGAAEWIVDHQVSFLCWDFLDAVSPAEPPRQVHSLVWAVGLVLVDNCNLAPAAQAARASGTAIGGLVVAPPPLPKATGCLVNPLFIQ
jgi:kynurenine formamidase